LNVLIVLLLEAAINVSLSGLNSSFVI